MTVFRRTPKARFILGVYQTSNGLRGALVRRDQDGPTFLRFFGGDHRAVEPTPTSARGASTTSFVASSYAGNGVDGSADIFLASEFGQITTPSMEAAAPSTLSLDTSLAAADELTAMLAGCRNEGASEVEINWCLDTTQVAWTERSERERSRTSGLKLGRTDGSATDSLSGGRSVLHPMRSEGSAVSKYLAVAPSDQERASKTIASMQPDDDALCTRRVLDSEISALLALVQTSVHRTSDSGASADIPSLVVRIGENDVLVMVVSDARLERIELLRSLSIYDDPDTICSRIVLLQDEHGLGHVARIYLAHGAADLRVENAMRSHFRRSELISLTSELRQMSSSPEELDLADANAAGAALRDTLDLSVSDNLLEIPLRTPRRRNPYSWEVWTLLAVLSLTAIFFVGRFVHYQNEITSRRALIEAMTHDSHTSQLLRQRIDSLQAAYSVNMQGLAVLDSLLVGSDQWSRTFEKIAVHLSEIGNISIDQWRPTGAVVDVRGRSSSRDGVVEFARRIGGTIEELQYPNSEEALYVFRMKAPVSITLPSAAIYLRERASQSDSGRAAHHASIAYREDQAVSTQHPPIAAATGDSVLASAAAPLL